jgi:mRNA interferase MazF
MAPGTVVLVPFPFTDLSGRKQRPAIVVSLERFHDEDVVVCAVTSQVPRTLSRWELALSADDLEERRLPKPSVILVGKLFTIHRELIVGRYGRLRNQKLAEVLGRLRELFGGESG